MFIRFTRIGLAAALAASATVGFSAPVQAAGAPGCAVGMWQLTKQNVVIKGTHKGKKYTSTYKGATGVRMAITSSKVTMDFNRSTKQLDAWSFDNTKGYEVYRGKLLAALTLTGSKQGKFIMATKTARGNATGHLYMTSPKQVDRGSYDVDKAIRNYTYKNAYDSLAPIKGAYRCWPKTLKLTRKFNATYKTGKEVASFTYLYRRV
jgi:hypothetical protein